LRVNDLTRKLGKKLFAAASVGLDGWMFADLLSHEFIVCAPLSRSLSSRERQH